MVQETGQHIQEDNLEVEEQKHNNTNFGRPWSGWVGLNVVTKELGVPTITQAPAQHYTRGRDDDKHVFEISHVAGRGEPGARVCLNLPAHTHYWVNVDGAGNWSITINHRRSSTFADLEVYQVKDGFNNSRTGLYHINVVGTLFFMGVR